VEHSDGFRSGMRAWNRTVQFWLAKFVYRRTNKAIRYLHMFSRIFSAFRMPYTMLVSAFWHGIHPGYFLSFMTIPLCTTAEDLLFGIVPTNPQTNQRPLWFRSM
jgi:lysophospholipid acyltransferase 7